MGPQMTGPSGLYWAYERISTPGTVGGIQLIGCEKDISLRNPRLLKMKLNY